MTSSERLDCSVGHCAKSSLILDWRFHRVCANDASKQADRLTFSVFFLSLRPTTQPKLIILLLASPIAQKRADQHIAWRAIFALSLNLARALLPFDYDSAKMFSWHSEIVVNCSCSAQPFSWKRHRQLHLYKCKAGGADRSGCSRTP